MQCCDKTIRIRIVSAFLLFAVAAAVVAQVQNPLNKPDSSTVTSPPHHFTIPKPRPEILAYNRIGYALYFVGTAWELLGLWMIFSSGLSAKFSNIANPLSRFRLIRAAVFFALLSAFMLAWRLPLSLAGFLIERHYGLSAMSPWLWIADLGRGYLFGLIKIPAVWLGYLLLERSPGRWWLWLWAASVPWTLAMAVLYPVFIAPAYNHFKPFPDTPLRRELISLADRAGIHGAKVYLVDISRRTKKLNAYVAGLGPTKRIVIWDTTLRGFSDDQILAIAGHEMGHYVLGHVWQGFYAGAFGAFVMLWLLSRLLPWVIGRFGERKGVREIHDLAGLPVVLIIFTGMLFLQTPIESAFTRWQEHEADRYGLQLTHLNEATARVFIGFVEHNYSDPDPPSFITFWFGSHPPLKDRVEFALTYHPWAAPRR